MLSERAAINLQSIVTVTPASVVVTTGESILGASMERRKWISNEAVNSINVSTGAGMFLFLTKACCNFVYAVCRAKRLFALQ